MIVRPLDDARRAKLFCYLSALPYREFDEGDWESFCGCETDRPVIHWPDPGGHSHRADPLAELGNGVVVREVYPDGRVTYTLHFDPDEFGYPTCVGFELSLRWGEGRAPQLGYWDNCDNTFQRQKLEELVDSVDVPGFPSGRPERVPWDSAEFPEPINQQQAGG